MKLKNGLSYGTRNAPMLWQNKMRNGLESLVERCPEDHSVYRHLDDMDLIMVTLSGHYDVVMRTNEALKLEMQVKTNRKSVVNSGNLEIKHSSGKDNNENDKKIQSLEHHVQAQS